MSFRHGILFAFIAICFAMPAKHLGAQTVRSGGAAVEVEGNVLVLGGTGRLGARVVKRLIERGFNVTVMARGQSGLERLKDMDVEIILGDVTVERDMQWALQGRRYHAVIDALSATAQEQDFDAEKSKDKSLMPYAPAQEYLARWGNVGIDHVVLHSSAGAGDDDNAADFPDINFESFGPVLLEKGKAEERLRGSGRSFSIIRSGAILASADRGITPYTGNGYLSEDTKLVGPITYDDLAILVADCALNPACMNKEFHATDDTMGEHFDHWRCRRFRSSPDDVC